MSTPLYIQTPTVGNGALGIAGQDLTTYGSVTVTDLTGIVTEPTLIEDLSWSAHEFSTRLGMVVLCISDGTFKRSVGAYPLPVGTADLYASGRLSINVVVPAGFRLEVAHNVKASGGAYTNVDFVPLGGIVR